MAKTIMKEKEAEEKINANNEDEPLNLSANSTVSIPSRSVIGTIIDIAMNNNPNNSSEGMFLDWWNTIEFIYSEKATKFCEISTSYLSYLLPVRELVEISQNFVAFSECMNFT